MVFDAMFVKKIQGTAAENAAASDNPVLVGGRYDSSDRTLGNGDVGALALTAAGHGKVEVYGSIVEEARRKLLIQEALDNIVDTIGQEYIQAFVPMWEETGAVFRDLFDRNRTFTVNGATLGQSGLLEYSPSFDGTNDYAIETSITEAIVDTNTQELAASGAVAVQKLVVIGDKIGKVRLRLIKEGSPDGNVKVEIRTAKDSAAITNGTSATLACSAIATSAENRGFVFSTPPSLSKGTTYYLALVYDSNTNADADNNIGWRYDSAGGYGEGRNYYDGSSWTDTPAEDFRFDVYSNWLTLPDDFTIITAAKSTASTIAFKNILYGNSMTALGVLRLGYSTTGVVTFIANDGTEMIPAVSKYPTNQFEVWAASFDKSETTKSKIYSNGKLEGTADGTPTNAQAALAHPIALGSIMTTVAFSNYWRGNISPFILVSKVLTPAEIAKVSHYLLALRKIREAI